MFVDSAFFTDFLSSSGLTLKTTGSLNYRRLNNKVEARCIGMCQIPALRKYLHDNQEGILEHPQLYSKFEVNLGYMSSCLKKYLCIVKLDNRIDVRGYLQTRKYSR